MKPFHVLARIGDQVYDLRMLEPDQCSVVSIINAAKKAWKRESVNENERWELSVRFPWADKRHKIETYEYLMRVFMMYDLQETTEIEFEVCEILTSAAIANPKRGVPTLNWTQDPTQKTSEPLASDGGAVETVTSADAENTEIEVHASVVVDGNIAALSETYEITEIDDEDYVHEEESDGGSSVSLVDEDEDSDNESREEHCDPNGIPNTIIMSSDEEENGLTRMAKYCSKHLWTPNPDGSIELKKGDIFSNIKSVRDVIIRYAIQEGFQLKKEKNDLCRYIVSCKNETCDWRVRVARLLDGVTFMVKSITGAHRMCPRLAANKEPKARWVAEVMAPTIQANPSISLKILHDELVERFTVDCDFQVVYRGKKLVLKNMRSDHMESYGKVRKYANAIIAMNPGSVAKVSVNLNAGPVAKFERFFLSFRVMQVGFTKGCRPFIGIDGCHLTSPFEGVMLSAIALDGDNGLFPIAFGVCESETTDSWRWFLKLLNESLDWDDNKPLCFMSDRQKGCLAALKIERPRASTRYCFMHMLKNFRNSFKSHCTEGKLWHTVRAGSRVDFNACLESVKEDCIEAYNWMCNEQPFEKWARYGFDERIKADHITNNMTESFNNWVKEERDKPILTLLEHLRRKMMVRFCDKWCEIEKMKDRITPYARLMLRKSEGDGRKLMVVHGRGEWYETIERRQRKILVSLEKRICECGLWQISGIPCKHVMTVLMYRKEMANDHVSWYYTKEAMQLAYNGAINPIPDEGNWPDFESQQIEPPLKRAKIGRPKKARRRAADEPRATRKTFTLKCRVCKVIGHNSRTCPLKKAQQTCNGGSTSGVTIEPSQNRQSSKKSFSSSSKSATTSRHITSATQQQECISQTNPSTCNERNESVAARLPSSHVTDICSQIGSTSEL